MKSLSQKCGQAFLFLSHEATAFDSFDITVIDAMQLSGMQNGYAICKYCH